MEFHGDCPLVIEHNYGQPPFLVAENRWGLPKTGKRFQKEVEDLGKTYEHDPSPSLNH